MNCRRRGKVGRKRVSDMILVFWMIIFLQLLWLHYRMVDIEWKGQN